MLSRRWILFNLLQKYDIVTTSRAHCATLRYTAANGQVIHFAYREALTKDVQARREHIVPVVSAEVYLLTRYL
jgi:hypothetical protein